MTSTPSANFKSQALHLVRAFSGFAVVLAPESGDKLTRFGPFSSQCGAGNLKILRGPWSEDLFRILEGFPDLAQDDEVDACSGALEMLDPQMKGWGNPLNFIKGKPSRCSLSATRRMRRHDCTLLSHAWR